MDKKFIEADLLKEEFERTFDMQDLYLPTHFFDVVDSIPSADVVEVVRCRDCEYLLKDLSERQAHICMRTPFCRKVEFDDFCSFGARKDGGDAE